MGNVFRADFFYHWDQLPIQIEDFPYEWMDYKSYSELPRPVGQGIRKIIYQGPLVQSSISYSHFLGMRSMEALGD